MSKRPSDPHTAFCFQFEIFGSDPEIGAQAYFKSVSGLQSKSDVETYKEGGLNIATRQLVGPTTFPNIVLKRGFTGPPWSLLKWRERWLDDSPGRKLERLNGRITQLSSDLKEVCSWHFYRAWPCKWEGPDFDADKSELAIETLEIAHERLVWKPAGAGGGVSSGTGGMFA